MSTSWSLLDYITLGYFSQAVVPPCGQEAPENYDLNAAEHKAVVALTEQELKDLRIALRPTGLLAGLLNQIPDAPPCPVNPYTKGKSEGCEFAPNSPLRELHRVVKKVH